MLDGDWANMIRAFENKYGKRIHPSRLPAQSYCETFEEQLASTTWKAETLAHVVSLAEEEKETSRRPEPARNVASTWTARLRFIPSANYPPRKRNFAGYGEYVPPREDETALSKLVS